MKNDCSHECAACLCLYTHVGYCERPNTNEDGL